MRHGYSRNRTRTYIRIPAECSGYAWLKEILTSGSDIKYGLKKKKVCYVSLKKENLC